jgi:lipopolysaccharide export system permease protein
MKLIERYIFGKILRTLLLTLVALSAMIWLTVALDEFNLVTNQGQTIWIFLNVTLLLLPALVIVVCPVALLIAVVYGLSSLNTDSELVVINATGARPLTLLKPVLLLGVLATVAIASMTLYFSPLSLRASRAIITSVHSGILSQILHEGEFMPISPGLVFEIRSRKPDGTLEGIFLSDSREKDTTLAYLAERGRIVQSPLGDFLVMNQGTIQQRNKADKTISIIEFTSYAIDLSTFSSATTAPELRPNERETEYLLHPDPNDRYFQQYPGKFRSELHDRITSPLYTLLFAVLPLLFLGQAETTRQSRALSIWSAVWASAAIRTLGMFLPGMVETNPAIVPVMYALPLGFAALMIILLLMGFQLRPPERIVAFSEAIFGRLGGLVRSPAGNPAQGRG